MATEQRRSLCYEIHRLTQYLSQVVQDGMFQSRIDVKLVGQARFQEGLHQYPHVFLAWWIADYPDPDTFLRTCLRAWSLWQDDTYDEPLTQAQCSVGQGERLALHAQANRILMELAPLLLFPHSQYRVLIKPWVRR